MQEKAIKANVPGLPISLKPNHQLVALDPKTKHGPVKFEVPRSKTLVKQLPAVKAI